MHCLHHHARRDAQRSRASLHAWIIFAAALLLSLSFVACGDGDSAGSQTPTPVDPDAGTDVDEEPDATIDTTPSDPDADDVETSDPSPDVPSSNATPAVLDVRVAPARAVYRLGLTITPTAIVYGTDGTQLTGYSPTWSVEPASAVEASGDGYTLVEEGRVTFIGCVQDDRLDEDLCGERTVVVDDGRPTLELFAPVGGSELLRIEQRTIEVRGRANDSSGELWVFVNGERAELDRGGNFTHRVEHHYGINHIDVIATDMRHEIEARAGADVMVAEAYVDYGPQTDSAGVVSASFPSALMLQLSQRFLDANLTIPFVPEEGMIRTTDLAGILELVLREIDLGGLIPDPISDSEDLFFRVSEFRPGDPRIDVTVTLRGVEIFVALPDMQIDTEGFFNVAGQELNLNGGVDVQMAAFVRMRLRKLPGQEFDVEVELVDLAMEDVVGRFASPQANAILAFAEGILFEAIENVALTTIEESFIDELPTLLEGAFSSIEDILSGQEFELDLGFGDPTTLFFDAELATLLPERRKHLTATLDVDISSDATPVHRGSRGIAIPVEIGTEPSLFDSARVQFVVDMTMLNGLLHVLWNSGLLEINLTDLLPGSISVIVESATISAQLPPHIRAARPGESAFPLLLTLGQMEMTMARGAREDILGMYVVAGIGLYIEDNALKIDIQGEPSIRLWQIETGGDAPLFDNLGELESLIESLVFPELAGSLTDGLSIDLPLIELSGISDIAPSLEGFALEVVQDRDVVVREGYLIVDIGLDGSVIVAE